MAILEKEEFFKRLNAMVGETDDDDALKNIEDFTDTYKDMETRIGEDWKRKYEENDAEWRKKYRERFFSGHETTPETVKEEQEEDVKEDGETVTFEDLFIEREGK